MLEGIVLPAEDVVAVLPVAGAWVVLVMGLCTAMRGRAGHCGPYEEERDKGGSKDGITYGSP